MEALTPAQNLSRNINALMYERRLNQQNVADHMATLGFSWYRKTVHRVLNDERPVRVDELYGLALVLDTTVGVLLSPDVTTDSHHNRFPQLMYRIGDMAPLPPDKFESLLGNPANRLERPDVGVSSWKQETYVGGVPRWKTWPVASLMDQLNDTLAKYGWRSIDEFMEANRPAAEIPWLELGRYIKEHPNTERDEPVE